MKILLLILTIFSLILTMAPVYPLLASNSEKKHIKSRFAIHFALFFLVLLITTILFFTKGLTANAMQAAHSAGGAKAAAKGIGEGLKALAAALATGIACVGAGIAVGGAAPAAIGAYSEDKETFGKAMIFVVLGEGIAIYGFVISFLILFSN